MSNVEDRRDYGAFIPSFLDDFRLDMPSFRLYAHIARRAGSGNCWESIDKMAETCQMNRKTAYKAFKLLQDHKLILVEKRKGQTSLITLTNHCVWIPIPNQAQVNPIPNQVQPYPKSGTPTYTKSGIGDIPNQGHPPIPNQVHKGTPIEVTPDQGTPIEGTPIKAEEDIYAPTTKPEILVEPVQQVLLDVLAEEKETPIPPTPLAPLSPENVGLAIAEVEKPKRRTVQPEDLEAYLPFLIVWNQTVPSHWDRYERLTVEMVDELKKFTKGKKAGTLEIFEEGLLEVARDPFLGSTKCEGWRFCSYFTNNKPRKYSGYYREKQARSQQLQTNGDRPMTTSDIRKAETYLKFKEALTA